MNKVICIICEKEFLNQSSLDTHGRKSHYFNEQLNKFQCDMCKKILKRFDSLEYHINAIHNNVKPHKCEFCNKTFSTKIILQKHVLSVHEGHGHM